MANLTDEQHAKLNALIVELETLPTPELIAESGRLRCSSPLNEAGKQRLRLAIGGGAAAQKIMAYRRVFSFSYSPRRARVATGSRARARRAVAMAV